jgi:ATP-dependent RNA circularization protein (DNA/RNA ligase family)
MAPFPKHLISMTDEDNLRTKYKCLSEYLDKEIYVTLKMDGSSMTLVRNNNEFYVCSRRLIVDNTTVMHQYVTREKLNEKIFALNKNIAIQGEFCGPKINGNQIGLKDYQFYIFNIKDLDTRKYYNLDEIIELCNELGIKMVPVLNKFTCTLDWTITKFQEYANTVTYTICANQKVPAEGIVIRPTKCIYSEILDKILSTKIINQNYKN